MASISGKIKNSISKLPLYTMMLTKKGNIINLMTMEDNVIEILFVRAPKYEYHPINITKIPKNCKNPSSLPYSSGNNPSLTNIFD